MHLDHIAIAVRSIDAALKKSPAILGYQQRTTPVTNSRQRVNVVFLSRAGSPDLKLIEPSSGDSPLWASLRAKGEGLHHLCFRVEDTSSGLAELSDRGLRVLATPEPGEAFAEHLIAFGYAGCGLNIEVIDTDERRDEIESPSSD